MTILQMQPNEVICPSWLSDYERCVTAVWWQLVRFNTTLRVLERLLQFRFDLFVEGDHTFWQTVRQALIDTCIMAGWRLAVDPHKDGLSLQRLKNEILRNMATDTYRDELKTALKQEDFAKAIAGIKPRIEELRHNYIAHPNREKLTRPTTQDIQNRTLLLSDLQDLRKALNSLFQILCFGDQRSVLTWDYDDDVECPAGTDEGIDVDRLLDEIAKQSKLLNLPERNPAVWAALKELKTPGDLQVINEYRKRFGLKVA